MGARYVLGTEYYDACALLEILRSGTNNGYLGCWCVPSFPFNIILLTNVAFAL